MLVPRTAVAVLLLFWHVFYNSFNLKKFIFLVFICSTLVIKFVQSFLSLCVFVRYYFIWVRWYSRENIYSYTLFHLFDVLNLCRETCSLNDCLSLTIYKENNNISSENDISINCVEINLYFRCKCVCFDF